jgi:hypothetical protein
MIKNSNYFAIMDNPFMVKARNYFAMMDSPFLVESSFVYC